METGETGTTENKGLQTTRQEIGDTIITQQEDKPMTGKGESQGSKESNKTHDITQYKRNTDRNSKQSMNCRVQEHATCRRGIFPSQIFCIILYVYLPTFLFV